MSTQTSKRPETDQRLRLALSRLKQAGLNPILPSPWHIKTGRFNYFWTTQKITVDGSGTVQERGIDAFIDMTARAKIIGSETIVRTAISSSPPISNVPASTWRLDQENPPF